MATNEPAGPWSSDCRIEIGRVLAGAEGPMTIPELASATGRDPSNLKKVADAMAAEGTLRRQEAPPAALGKRGPKAKSSYTIATGIEAPVEGPCEGPPNSDALGPGDQLIFLEAAAPDANLLECLSGPQVSARVEWSALCDGGGQELMLAVRGPGAADTSLDLMGALSAAKVKARRVTVAKVDSGAELASWAARSRRADKGGRS